MVYFHPLALTLKYLFTVKLVFMIKKQFDDTSAQYEYIDILLPVVLT